MEVISVNIGLPRTVKSGDTKTRTAIFKSPVSGRVSVRGHNLAGDRQADTRVHGGPRKAVYAYPSEHYAFWKEQLPDLDIASWGSFGENLTMTGLLEDDVHVGDRLRIGSTELVVTQPRMPCFKLGLRMGRADFVKRFMDSERSGFYLSIAVEGDIAAGDTIQFIDRNTAGASIREDFRARRARTT